LTLLSSTPRYTGAPSRISSGSSRWQPRVCRIRADSPAPHAELLLVRFGGRAQRPALGGRRRSDHNLREAEVDLHTCRGEELQPGLKGAGASPGEEGGRRGGAAVQPQPTAAALAMACTRGGETERRWRRRNPGGFAPCARFRRTKSTRISGRYSLPGEPSPTAPQANTKRVRPIRVGLSTVISCRARRQQVSRGCLLPLSRWIR
jgi:hypothetical protein